MAFALRGVWERVKAVSPVEREEIVYSAFTEGETPPRIRVEHGRRISTVTSEGLPDTERIGYGFVSVEQEALCSYVPGPLTRDARGSCVDSRADSRAVPFGMSSLGYGVALSGPGDFQFDVASVAELFPFLGDGESVSFRICTDPTLNRIVERYAKASG